PVKALHFSADGRRLLAATERAVRVWQFPDGRPLSEEWAHPAPVVSAQFDADGRSVVTACEDFVVRIWKVGPGVQPAHTLPHTERLLRAEFDRSGRRVLTSCWDGNTHLWDAQGGRWLLAWPHEHRVTHAEFSPDGCRVVTASIDRTAAIWNVDSGAPSPRSVRHDGDVLSARFSPDGRWIITASRDGTARVWDSESGEPVSEAMHHDTAVTHVRFSPDGLRVLTGTANGSVRLWDAATGLPVSDPFPQAGELVDLAFSPCGRSFITVSHTGEAQLYMVFQAHGPAPAWLAPLAEAVGGKRFNSRGMLDDVPPQAIFDLQRQLEQTRSSDPYSAWARWFLDRTALRQIAPGLALRQPDWVAHQMAAGSLAGLRAALALEPTNSLIYAQLARRLAEHENDLRAQKQAAWCLRRARELGGSDASRWAEGGSAPAPSSEAGGRKRPPAATLSTHPLLD
ncbi:MAG TPA: WD40 repeat domain-containing protein, partial [Methylomirabilota bacterium]|nr:WD40 repeat domain-containing protein [Methylomirabilota bacterium]